MWPLRMQHEPVYTVGKRGSLADFRNGVEVRATCPVWMATSATGPGRAGVPRMLPASVQLQWRHRELPARPTHHFTGPAPSTHPRP
jgi:hypothetical protein